MYSVVHTREKTYIHRTSGRQGGARLAGLEENDPAGRVLLVMVALEGVHLGLHAILSQQP
jgi:hypothetical protein